MPTCDICTELVIEVTNTCECLHSCVNCLREEGRAIYRNRGVKSILKNMLTCTLCNTAKDINIYPLKKNKKREIENALNTEQVLNIEVDGNRCPGCQIVIERDGGCFHMTHTNCPGRNGVDVHYCDCCNEELYLIESQWYDGHNNIHFPSGTYRNCINRNVNENIIREENRINIIRNEINNTINDFQNRINVIPNNRIQLELHNLLNNLLNNLENNFLENFIF